MKLIKKNFLSEYYANKTAFVLNANAKSVTDRVVNRLVEVVPAGDLFYSRSLKESENFYRTILRRGYARVFSGGGDGTLVNAINTIKKISKKELFNRLPAVGVLKLGTGNAMASIVGAQSPWIDVNHVIKGGGVSHQAMNLVECDNGKLTPFAGIGYDGELLNDYFDLKREHKGRPTERLMNSVFGFIWAGLARTMPRNIGKGQQRVRIHTHSDAYRVFKSSTGQIFEEPIKAGSVLYEGPACVTGLGSISCFGYNFRAFPFSNHKKGHVQLRVCAMGIPTILANVYPSIWKGTFQHEKLYDYLIKDITVECEKEAPYQIGGDAAGYKRSLRFKAAEEVVTMAKLDQQRLQAPRGILGLLPAPIFAKN